MRKLLVIGAFLYTIVYVYAGSLDAPAYANAGVSQTASAQESARVQAAVSSVESDIRASDVAIASSSVGMTYPIKAKLFGVFPVTLTVHARVESSGTVSVRYPWYAFLFSTDQAALQTKLEAIGQAAAAWNTASFDAQQQLALLALIHTALESNLESGTGASGEVQ